MSQRYTSESNDPLALIPFGEEALDGVTAAARVSARKRSIVRFHEHGDGVQRMLNALEPESYVRPHRHAVAGEAGGVCGAQGELTGGEVWGWG